MSGTSDNATLRAVFLALVKKLPLSKINKYQATNLAADIPALLVALTFALKVADPRAGGLILLAALALTYLCVFYVCEL